MKSLRLFLMALPLLLIFLACGCKSVEPANESARPWNSPRGWEGGAMPGLMPNYRR